MKIHFSKNSKFYSKLLMFLCKEPVSHVGLEFFSGTLNLAMDCTKPYGKVYHIKQWRKNYDIVCTMHLRMGDDDELITYTEAAKKSVLVGYDWGAYYYGFIAVIKRFIFGTPLPKTNKWQSDDVRICTEILDPLKKILLRYDIDIMDLDFTALTPYEAACELRIRSVGKLGVTWYGLTYQQAEKKRRFGMFPLNLLRKDKL